MRFLSQQLWPNCFHKSYTVTRSFIALDKALPRRIRMMKSLILMKMKTWGQRRLIGSQWIFEARALASGSALQQVNNKKTSWSFVPKNLIFAKTKGRGYNLWKFVSRICVDGQIDVAFLKPAWEYPKGLGGCDQAGRFNKHMSQTLHKGFHTVLWSFQIALVVSLTNILQPTLVKCVNCARRFNVFQPSSNLVLSICS